MTFEQALYYPWIDIDNSEWLKTAILYWDRISTIVPFGMECPYQNAETITLQMENVLVPYFINPDSQCVQRAGKTFQTYLDSEEVQTFLTVPLMNNQERMLDQNLSRVYVEKLAYSLRDKLNSLPRVLDRGGYLELDNQTATYYMNLLAVEISQENKWGLLTDSVQSETVSNIVKRGDSPILHRRFGDCINQGSLIQTVFTAFKISQDIPIDDILKFRQAHNDELVNFRKGISDFSRMIDPDIANMIDLENEVNRIYLEYIQPSIRNLERELHSASIGFTLSSIASIGFTVGDVLLNANQNNIVNIIRGGYEFIVSAASFHRNKLRKLEASPWSYLLSLRQLG